MEEEFENLVEALKDGDVDEPRVEGIFKDSCGGKNPVYVTVFEEHKLQLINSSNQEPIHDFGHIFDSIAEEIEDGAEEGEVSDSGTWNQIYWEVIEKDSNGSLIK